MHLLDALRKFLEERTVSENQQLKELIKKELIFSLENKDEANSLTIKWREDMLEIYFPGTKITDNKKI